MRSHCYEVCLRSLCIQVDDSLHHIHDRMKDASGCVRRTWYMHDKQHQRATRVFCVCVFKLYSVNIKQHSWYILLSCQEPVLSYPLLCFYAPEPAVDPQHIQTDIQSPCIIYFLGDKTKARPQSHCELYAASDPPQSLH